MRYILATCLLLMLAYRVSGQSVSELISALEKAETDSLKIVAYQSLVNHYGYNDSDSAIMVANKGLTYARQNAYQFGQGIMTSTLAQLNERHGDLDIAKKQYLEARRTFARMGYTKGIAVTTNGLGVIAGKTGKYDEATRYFLEALNLFESTGDTESLVQTYIKLGVLNDHLNNLEGALAYYLKAETLNASSPSENATLTLLNNIGIIYGKRNNVREALQYFHKGLRESSPATGIHIALLGSLGLAYDKLGLPDSAWHYQQQALSMARGADMPEEEARSLVNLAAMVKNTDPTQSLVLLGEALIITERIQQMQLLTEVYESMIAVHKHNNDFRQALHLSEKRQLLKDSLFSIQRSKEIANLHATHELARQENEIRNLALQNEKSMFQRNLMLFVALVSIAIIVIVWFYNTKISNLNTLLIRKQLELQGSNTIKDKLFSILGHDLRAPLTRVIGMLNMLSSKHQNQDGKMIIEKLTHQSLNTLETLDNLLMWGRSQLKGIKLNQQTIPANEHVRKSILLSSDYAAQKNINIVDNVSPDLQVHVDPSHFDFIIRNLLSNAVKFSHSGGTVTISALPSAGQHVVFSIKDAGIGIHPDIQKKIFSFTSGSLKGTWNEKGTGIGLVLCKEYIIENGGKLWLESEEGKGATFYFSLRQKTVARQQVLFPETA